MLSLVVGCGSDGSDGNNDSSNGSETPPETGSESWLFSQSAERASIEWVGDRALLHLGGLSASTVAFTDRPDRLSRSLSTATFLERWQLLFGDEAPNAALVVTDGERTATVTIEAARYAGDGGDGYYRLAPLDDALAELPAGIDLGPANLFIDDVPGPEALDGAGQSMTTDVIARSLSSGGIAVDFDSLNGNLPETYANTIFVWEAETVLWDSAPDATFPVGANVTVGSQTLAGLDSDTAYTLAYAVGSEVGTTAATVTLTPGSSMRTQSIEISIEATTVGLIELGFDLPEEMNPAEYGHWVGIWPSSSLSPGNSVPPVGRASVETDQSQGSVALEGVELLRGVVYTIGYFTGSEHTTLAATVTTVF